MKAFKLFLILLCLLILGIGALATIQNTEQAETRYEESLQYYEQARDIARRDTQIILEALRSGMPPQPEIQTKPSSLGDPYLNAAQGVEVLIRGMEWNGLMIDSVIAPLKTRFGARYILNHNQLTLDPDFPHCGYPDLHILIPDAPSLQMDSKDLVSRSFRRSLNKEKPLESYNLDLGDNRRGRMDLWLANFEIVFRIIPDEHDRDNNLPYDGWNHLTRTSGNDIRRVREFKDQRYGNMTLFLEFKPKNTWYIGEKNENGLFVVNKQPRIGIAAVEAIKIQKVGEEGINNKDRRIALSVENGMAFPLYDSFEELAAVFMGGAPPAPVRSSSPPPEDPFSAMADNTENAARIYNPELFGRSKYTAVQIKNLGSWKDRERGWLFGSRTYNADLFRASFFVHLYVIGEWTVKPESFVATQLQPPVRFVKPGLFDYILPSFGLGRFGQIFSGAVIFIILFVLLGAFIRPIGRILDFIIRKILHITSE